jgi:hypothetical protein
MKLQIKSKKFLKNSCHNSRKSEARNSKYENSIFSKSISTQEYSGAFCHPELVCRQASLFQDLNQ